MRFWPTTIASHAITSACRAPSAADFAARIRRFFAIQALAYFGKVAIHPTPLASLAELWERTAVGPIPGQAMVLGGLLFNGAWLAFALVTWHLDRTQHRGRSRVAMG